MALLSSLSGNIVYLDTNIFIYAMEGYAAFESALRDLFESMSRGDLLAVTSELTLAEVLVKPFRDEREDWIRAYTAAVHQRSSLRVVPIDRATLIEAARLRATLGLRLPDAIHAATAVRAGCTTFLTNDVTFRSLLAITVVCLSDVIMS